LIPEVVTGGCHVHYQAHVENIGWLPEVSDGQIAGTTGQGRQMEALRVWLDWRDIPLAGDIDNASGIVGLRVASLLGPGSGGVDGSGALATVELLIAATGGGAIGLSDILPVDSSEALIEAMTRDGITRWNRQCSGT